MGYSKTKGILRKDNFFLQNNENRSEFIPRKFPKQNFNSNPLLSAVGRSWMPSSSRVEGCSQPALEGAPRLLTSGPKMDL